MTREEQEEWYRKFILWLDSLEANTKFTRPVSDTLANHVRQWWYALETVCGVNVPIAGQLESEVGFYFCWNYEHAILEFEIYPNSSALWWGKDRVTGYHDGAALGNYHLDYELEDWIKKVLLRK